MITKDEIELARRDYSQWAAERRARGQHGSWADDLWNAVRKENTELAAWFEPLLESHYRADSQEGEVLKAALSIMYDLLRRREVGQIMNQGYFSSSALGQALPKSFLKIPSRPGSHALFMQDLAKSGKVAMEHEQDWQRLLDEIWSLLPEVLDADITAYNSDTVGHYKSLVMWATYVMYGCLRQQLEQSQK